MSVRLYVGNLPQTFDAKELEALFSNVGEGVRFKAVNDRDTGACRGFGFVNLDRDADRNGVFNVAIDRNGSNLFGIKPGRSYNIRNLAAYTAQESSRDDVLLWPSPRSGSQVLASGSDVFLKKVPTDTAGWTGAPYEA